MPKAARYAPGTPCWVDLGSDVEAAKRFYGGLFGWEPLDAGPPEQTGGYGFFALGGRLVAGYGPQQQPGSPAWTTYFAVDDARSTAVEVVAAGGRVVTEPLDVMEAGTMVVFRDPAGALFSVWQPARHPGAEVTGEPGSMSWSELNTRDLTAAKAFYTTVLGWEVQTRAAGPVSYTEASVDGRPVAGMLDMTGRVPEEVPAHWMVYFAVDDCDAAAAKVGELGGGLLVGPFDLPAGRFAVVADDRGAHFAVIRRA